MSTFKGKIEEIPEISVDRFEEGNLDSEAFFLSHCHTDHMVGINTPEFREVLLKRNRFIYVSHVTKGILKQMHPYLKDQIRELDFHTPTPIYLKNRCISVIPIPSGHCPGSVMFLFEGSKTVLYTGDYRINLKDIKKIRAFYDDHGNMKKIHTVYLDTTFFLRDYMQFPTREESLHHIISLIEEWMSLGEEHIIHISVSAKYGYEYVFKEIFDKVKMPIHINEKAFDFYSLIPQLDGAITLTGENTRIHCSCGDSFNKICKNKEEYNIRTIKMSAMRWKNKDLEEGFTTNESESHFVCYSTHASYTEGVELIEFLKPKAIEPCVLRFDEDLDNQIYSSINELLNRDNEPKAKKPKLFDLKKLKNTQEAKTEKFSGVDQKYNDIFDEALDSPPEMTIPD
ncbi:protein artemis [Coccinella septempunctata]|uniref:protein artemis n=1 Tax=Coccinella septempunctata TaxID=41139 RepID=UPI001D05F406|nr:protein artemis [Coccinella septempunctata]